MGYNLFISHNTYSLTFDYFKGAELYYYTAVAKYISVKTVILFIFLNYGLATHEKIL